MGSLRRKFAPSSMEFGFPRRETGVGPWSSSDNRRDAADDDESETAEEMDEDKVAVHECSEERSLETADAAAATSSRGVFTSISRTTIGPLAGL